MNTAVDKKRAASLKEKIDILQNYSVTFPDSVEAEKEKLVKTEEPEQPFGGGELLGLIVNPTAKEVSEAQGFDKYGLSHGRSYGCSQYLPLVQHCNMLISSEDRIDRMIGYKRLGDRFMIKRSTGAPFSPAEEAIYRKGHEVGQNLLDKGALYPLTFPSIAVMGHTGFETLPAHWIPSTGFANAEILPAFLDYMEDLSRWLQKTRIEVTNLYVEIESGRVAPIRGYEQ